MSTIKFISSSNRHAIEVNKRDYRAWYGLGQTYEILKMPFYCLYYYRKAHQLRSVLCTQIKRTIIRFHSFKTVILNWWAFLGGQNAHICTCQTFNVRKKPMN